MSKAPITSLPFKEAPFAAIVDLLAPMANRRHACVVGAGVGDCVVGAGVGADVGASTSIGPGGAEVGDPVGAIVRRWLGINVGARVGSSGVGAKLGADV